MSATPAKPPESLGPVLTPFEPTQAFNDFGADASIVACLRRSKATRLRASRYSRPNATLAIFDRRVPECAINNANSIGRTAVHNGTSGVSREGPGIPDYGSP